MNWQKNQNISMIVFLTCFFILISIMMPVIAQGGNQHGQGSGNNGNDNNSPPDGEKQGAGKPGSGHEQQQNQNQMGSNQSNDGYGYQQKRHQHREMNCTGSHKRYLIRSQWRLNNAIDAFEIEFTIDPEPSLILYYMPTGNKSNIQLTFEITLKKLVEFADLNGNGRFDYSDSVVSAYAFEIVNFTNITYSNETLSLGENIVRMATQTVDGVFAIDLLIADNFTSFNNQILSPSEMKVDFIIHHYPYLENNTQLALLLEITTDHNFSIDAESFDEKRGYAFNESAVNISSMHYSGFFSWRNTVVVDGNNNSVQVSVLEEEHPGTEDVEKIRYISFSYPHGTEIIHDPKIGVISQSFTLAAANNAQLTNLITDLNVYYTYFISCALAILILIGIITLRKRF